MIDAAAVQSWSFPRSMVLHELPLEALPLGWIPDLGENGSRWPPLPLLLPPLLPPLFSSNGSTPRTSALFQSAAVLQLEGHFHEAQLARLQRTERAALAWIGRPSGDVRVSPGLSRMVARCRSSPQLTSPRSLPGLGQSIARGVYQQPEPSGPGWWRRASPE